MTASSTYQLWFRNITPKGIIRDRTLKVESEQNFAKYLKDQGFIAVKRFTIKKTMKILKQTHFF